MVVGTTTTLRDITLSRRELHDYDYPSPHPYSYVSWMGKKDIVVPAGTQVDVVWIDGTLIVVNYTLDGVVYGKGFLHQGFGKPTVADLFVDNDVQETTPKFTEYPGGDRDTLLGTFGRLSATQLDLLAFTWTDRYGYKQRSISISDSKDVCLASASSVEGLWTCAVVRTLRDPRIWCHEKADYISQQELTDKFNAL